MLQKVTKPVWLRTSPWRARAALFLQRLRNRDGTAFRSRDGALCGLEAAQFQSDGVYSGADFYTRGSDLARGIAIDKYFSAGRIARHVSPCNPSAGTLVQLGVQHGLDVFLHLNAADVGIVAREAQHEVVLAGGERQSDRRLSRLFCAIDENRSEEHTSELQSRL